MSLRVFDMGRSFRPNPEAIFVRREDPDTDTTIRQLMLYARSIAAAGAEGFTLPCGHRVVVLRRGKDNKLRVQK